jgi:hypothetical protein
MIHKISQKCVGQPKWVIHTFKTTKVDLTLVNPYKRTFSNTETQGTCVRARTCV